MKKTLAIVLAAVVLLSLFSGCGAKADDEGEEMMKRYGDTDSRNPLRVCVDIQTFWTGDPLHLDSAMESFVAALKEQTGLKKVVVEYVPEPTAGMSEEEMYSSPVPPNSTIRKTTLDRLRVELMSGGGPDMFIIAYQGQGRSLFKFPQKSMELGFFLPLDEYMQKAKYAEWEKYPKAIMDAGRNDEGQQIIPLTYTLPIVMYPKLAFEYAHDREFSWNDMLTDPVLAPYAAPLADCAEDDDIAGETMRVAKTGELDHVLGRIADYEKEELLFTEEELLARTNEVLSIIADEELTQNAVETQISWQLHSGTYPAEMTMLPMYNDDGGVSAAIASYAAVNRNTQKAEEAFQVIDFLLDAKRQSTSEIYGNFLCLFYGVPLHEDIMSSSLPLRRQFSMTTGNFEEFSAVRGEISTAFFETELRDCLQGMLAECLAVENTGKTVEEIVHQTYEDMERRIKE